MTDDGDEPWSNGYRLAADVMELVERLREGDLDLEAVQRSFLREDEIASLLPASDRRTEEQDLLEGLGTFLATRGRSHAFGAALHRSRARADRFREALAWSELPERLRALCERRAQTVLARALEEGFVAGPEPYRITPEGTAFLEAGGYSMR